MKAVMNTPLFETGEAVCGLSVVPVRLEPDSRSELTSQVRLGEPVWMLEHGPESFVRVESLLDGYKGWVDRRHFVPVEEAEPAARFLTDDMAGMAVPVEGGPPLLVPLATRLPEWDGRTFRTGGVRYAWQGTVREIPLGGTGAEILDYAARFLSTPYVWGGRSVFGIDCSGFVQNVWAAFGVYLRRDTLHQVHNGTALESLEQAQAGDLAFFDDGVRVRHVGLCTGDGRIIHASSRVRVDRLTEEGIFNAETGELSHRYMCARRVRPA